MSARTRFIEARDAARVADAIYTMTDLEFPPALFADRYAAVAEGELRNSGEHAAADALLACLEED